MNPLPIILLLGVLLTACVAKQEIMTEEHPSEEIATFAGGCFWCMEPPFEKLDGVHEVISGYAGGEEANPTYDDVSSGSTGHREAVQVHYDPKKITYKELLDIYWRQFDPTDADGSFGDRGFQYTSAIFHHDEEQKKLAEASKTSIQKYFKAPIVTPILQFTSFYPAEQYHQNYHEKNPIRYKFYRSRSGRDEFIKNTWNSQEKLQLTEMQYKVTKENGTEPPFENEYWDNHEPGIYVDLTSGEPLFSSTDKFESGTGWPSFSKPLVEENIVEKKDFKIIVPRTEIRSNNGDNHLGHLFKDGPEPTGLRYCMNSAALRFVSAEDLEKEGYGEFKALFT